MKLLYIFTFLFVANYSSYAQQKYFKVNTIALPPEISCAENQFSGLQIAHQNLYLLSECRLQDKREAKLYYTTLSAIAAWQKDTTQQLTFTKIKIIGLDSIALQLKQLGDVYEGLEAFVIKGNTVYFSIETNTPSPNCYFIKGKLKKGTIYLLPAFKKVAKPRKPDGSRIYNAGFEAVTLLKKRLYAFFEYNYFNSNYVYSYDTNLANRQTDSVPFGKLPFRITDITRVSKNNYTAINFFFKGEGEDEVYRVSPFDTVNNNLITKNHVYQNYCRLIRINFNNGMFNWSQLWEFPADYSGYNWEGIAAWKQGYFIINDKYTPARPYQSVLLYIH